MTIDFYYQTLGKDKDIVSVVLSGRLDAVTSDYLLDCVARQVEEGYTKVILDCDQLSYISSVGLGMLIRVNSRMKRVGGDVKLAALHGAVAQVLRLAKLDLVFQLYPTVEEAVAAHGG